MEIKRVGGVETQQVGSGERKAKKGGSASSTAGPKDQLSLSRQAVAYIEAQAKQAMEAGQKAREKREAALMPGESGLLKGMEKSLKEMARCQKIAARIMAGDKVPPEDHSYLMEHDPKGYQLAMAMRKIKKDPKEWESALDKEEEEDGAEAAGEAPAPASGGTGEAEAAPAAESEGAEA